MAFYETEKTGSVPPSDLAKSLMQYRRAHNLSREELAKKLSPLSFDQIKNWELGRGEPSASTILVLADKLNVSCDSLLRGCPSELAGVRTLTGLSGHAVANLHAIRQEHDAEPVVHAHLLPLLDMLLSDKRFLDEVEAKVWRLVHLKAEQSACGCDEETETSDLIDSVEYKLSRMVVESVRRYADSVVPAESDAMRREELESMAAEIRRREME